MAKRSVLSYFCDVRCYQTRILRFGKAKAGQIAARVRGLPWLMVVGKTSVM